MVKGSGVAIGNVAKFEVKVGWVKVCWKIFSSCNEGWRWVSSTLPSIAAKMPLAASLPWDRVEAAPKPPEAGPIGCRSELFIEVNVLTIRQHGSNHSLKALQCANECILQSCNQRSLFFSV